VSRARLPIPPLAQSLRSHPFRIHSSWILRGRQNSPDERSGSGVSGGDRTKGRATRWGQFARSASARRRRHDVAEQLAAWLVEQEDQLPDSCRLPTSSVKLLVPVPRPNKLFLLAGNYAAHIEEGGGIAAERAETFPYVFMKPPTTTLTHPGDAIHVPNVSPNHIDWELELAVVIGRRAKSVREGGCAAAVCRGLYDHHDISDRKFRPNPERKKREKDVFFDWLHGKWHDSFCPCGPCLASPSEIPDPQDLAMLLMVNGEVKQQASTALQIFPVAAVIEFISSFVTLEPGDIISTGTPAGVGNTTGQYLQPGDQVERLHYAYRSAHLSSSRRIGVIERGIRCGRRADSAILG
jgi:2,4-didehydro-3-deoxy-L-rhamnonate hydrolase